MDIDKLSAAYEEFYSFIRKLPPELTIKPMRYFFKILPFEHLADYEVRDERLKTVLRGPSKDANLELENPVILAAGYEPGILGKALEMGYGAGIAKASLEPMKGNKGRTIIRDPEGSLNSVGYENGGIADVYRKLEEVRKRVGPEKRIILQISDRSIDNYLAAAHYVEDMERKSGIVVVDMFELNSCPNCADVDRLDFFRNNGYAEDLSREFRKATKKPLGVKLPREKDCPGMYRTIKTVLGNGFTVLNYANGMWVEDGRFERGFAMRSGPGLYTDTYMKTYGLHKEFGDYADNIATGGIDSPYKAYEILKTGKAKAISGMEVFSRDICFAPKTNRYLSQTL